MQPILLNTYKAIMFQEVSHSSDAMEQFTESGMCINICMTGICTTRELNILLKYIFLLSRLPTNKYLCMDKDYQTLSDIIR